MNEFRFHDSRKVLLSFRAYYKHDCYHKNSITYVLIKSQNVKLQ